MSENKRREPKKIKMPPLVDRYNEYGTMVNGEESKTPQPYWKNFAANENHNENNSTSIQPLESDSTN